MDSENTEKELKNIIEQQRTVIHSLEKSLNESESTIRSIVSRLPLGFLVLNQEFKIEASNNRVVELFEYSTAELSNKTIDILFPDIGSITELAPNVELKAFTKSGKRKVTSVSVTSVRIKDQPRYFIHIYDMTEKHRLEQLKSDFVSMLSHDLRSPIASLQVLLTMLENGDYGKLESDGSKRVSGAKRSTDRLIKMISELLYLEKMEEGLFKMNKSECSVSSIINGAIDDVFELCEAKEIEINSNLGNHTSFCDSDQIRRVVVNLLTNSIKFAPGGSTISLSVEKQSDNLIISIEDQGSGIQEDLLKSIFDRFQQGEDQSVGSGLGLAICKAIVDAHGGVIGVESELNKGSKFWFTIPGKVI